MRIDAWFAAYQRLRPTPWRDLVGSWWQQRDARGPLYSKSNYLHSIWAIADVLKPETYAEIGVRRGYSLKAFLTANPKLTAHCCDIQSPEANGRVEANARRDFPHAYVQIDSCSSATWHPRFFCDVAYVDGQHTEAAAYADCCWAWTMLNVGGHLVVDDMRLNAVLAGAMKFLNALGDGHVAQIIPTFTRPLIIKKGAD